jgi:hypothetical protein
MLLSLIKELIMTTTHRLHGWRSQVLRYVAFVHNGGTILTPIPFRTDEESVMVSPPECLDRPPFDAEEEGASEIEGFEGLDACSTSRSLTILIRSEILQTVLEGFPYFPFQPYFLIIPNVITAG